MTGQNQENQPGGKSDRQRKDFDTDGNKNKGISRRKFGILGGALALGAAGFTSLALGTSKSPSGIDMKLDWPMPRYDARGTRYKPDTSLPEDGLEIEWEYKYSDDRYESSVSPVVVDEFLYLVNEYPDRILCLNAQTGEKIFELLNNDTFYESPPVVAPNATYQNSNLVFITNEGLKSHNSGGGDGFFENWLGSERWMYPNRDDILGSSVSNFSISGRSFNSPVLYGDTIYAGLSGEGMVVALGAGDGSERWTYSPSYTGTETPVSQPAVYNYFGEDVGYGPREDDEIDSPPSGTVCVNIDDEIHFLSAESGELEGKFRVDGFTDQTVRPPVVSNRLVFAPIYDTLYVLDANTGEEKWNFEKEDSSNIPSPLAVTNDTVFLSGEEHIHALDTKTGNEKWVKKRNSNNRVKGLVAEDIFCLSDGNLYAFDEKTGEKLWKVEFSGNISPEIALANDSIYVTSENKVYRLSNPNQANSLMGG